MNINQWISCISEAYEITGKVFSPRIKEILLGRLSIDDVNKNEVEKGIFEMGVVSKPFKMQDESQNEVIEEMWEVITRCFFNKIMRGETFGSISRVEERLGSPVEKNYELSSGPFVNMARTYWTYKIEVHDLFPKYYDLALSQVLLKVEGDIASVFFSTPDAAVIWVGQRREMQRKLLKQYAPKINIDIFLENNPILGTSKGAISKRVFNEKILIRCQNPNCLHVLRIPNTLKILRVTCPKCNTSFRFPVKDLQWLNQLRPDVHPEPYKIDELENLRQLYNIPHEIFATRIAGIPWTTRRVLESTYAQYRVPGESEKETLKAVFSSYAPLWIPKSLVGMTEEEINEAMESINSLEDLISYFIKRNEAEGPTSVDPFGIGAKIDEILSR